MQNLKELNKLHKEALEMDEKIEKEKHLRNALESLKGNQLSNVKNFLSKAELDDIIAQVFKISLHRILNLIFVATKRGEIGHNAIHEALDYRDWGEAVTDEDDRKIGEALLELFDAYYEDVKENSETEYLKEMPRTLKVVGKIRENFKDFPILSKNEQVTLLKGVKRSILGELGEK